MKTTRANRLVNHTEPSGVYGAGSLWRSVGKSPVVLAAAAGVVIALTHLSSWAQQERSEPDGGIQLCESAPITFSSESLMPEGHIKVQAERTEIINKQLALFSGNVDITSSQAIIHAQNAQIDQLGGQLQAEGNVTYQDPQMQVKSDRISLESADQRLQMVNTDYQLMGFNGHGAAEEILLDAESGLSLSDVSFTTCPLGGEDWKIQASEISIRKGTYWGQARNTRFYLGGVPVFYLPYFAFPVSNQRQTGLLFPEITSSSSTGLDYTQPFYWNIAPNYDMTLSPRLMTNRGIQLKTEFRYLSESGSSQINLEYLPNDQDLNANVDRYFYRVYHRGQINQNWLFGVDVNGISDDNYIVDLGSDFYNRADTHLYRTAGIHYFSDDLTFSFRARDFDTIGDHPGTYRALPEAQLSYVSDLGSWVELKLDSELAYFDTATAQKPTALRWHFAPTLVIPYRKPWGELSAEASLLNTYYRQDNIEGTELEEEVNRTLGQARLFGALYFERAQNWFGRDSTWTMEPKIQYLYTSYEDQSNIGLYDSTPLRTDVEGLFRGREFTGLDRISDNNQLTFGLTTRMIDDANREQFVLSLGQIFYLDDNRVTATREGEQSNRSALAAELDWRVSHRWYAHSDVQITTDTDKVERSSLSLEYRLEAQKLVQLTHRYVRNLSGETIDQVGLSASWPISENWLWVGRTYRDRERNRSIENYVGLQYESCCWAIRVVAQRHLSNRYDTGGDQSTNEFDTGISLQFIFKGMGSRSSNRAMLEDGMFGYRQPYSLN
ncbi:LPS-assembly protein LptD [Alteromonas aestuariivivens]|uniref:LPS-assembly protein LptD n=1 Tax=Alteromonas aestuariivivens TaxID=1938339 RepID=A0A3D8MCW3_9ALTE|nr:LPS assembly protein LptD [Alteromonas aestuariivivens]RDV28080.1 LPS-assembly protein LptD [Alteromonas aestuariivivens]